MLGREAATTRSGLFDHVIESSKVGVRKPDPRFYELACETCGVEPAEVVFLDDLGVNLKPAAAMGMTTIKVVDPADAIAQLGSRSSDSPSTESMLGLTLAQVPRARARSWVCSWAWTAWEPVAGLPDS